MHFCHLFQFERLPETTSDEAHEEAIFHPMGGAVLMWCNLMMRSTCPVHSALVIDDTAGDNLFISFDLSILSSCDGGHCWPTWFERELLSLSSRPPAADVRIHNNSLSNYMPKPDGSHVALIPLRNSNSPRAHEYSINFRRGRIFSVQLIKILSAMSRIRRLRLRWSRED